MVTPSLFPFQKGGRTQKGKIYNPGQEWCILIGWQWHHALSGGGNRSGRGGSLLYVHTKASWGSNSQGRFSLTHKAFSPPPIAFVIRFRRCQHLRAPPPQKKPQDAFKKKILILNTYIVFIVFILYIAIGALLQKILLQCYYFVQCIMCTLTENLLEIILLCCCRCCYNLLDHVPTFSIK